MTAAAALSGFGPDHHPSLLTGWMTIGEARAALAAAEQPALPVAGHRGLIGLITIEALGGAEGAPAPDCDAPLASVMDWHLVQVPPTADEDEVLRRYEEAARRWIRHGHGDDAVP